MFTFSINNKVAYFSLSRFLSLPTKSLPVFRTYYCGGLRRGRYLRCMGCVYLKNGDDGKGLVMVGIRCRDRAARLSETQFCVLYDDD